MRGELLCGLRSRELTGSFVPARHSVPGARHSATRPPATSPFLWAQRNGRKKRSPVRCRLARGYAPVTAACSFATLPCQGVLLNCNPLCFHQIVQIQLFPYERRALEALEQEFALERPLVVGFATSLNELACMFEKVTVGVEGEFRSGRVVIMGFINHVHHLLAGGLRALHDGNGPVWSACVRGLMETFGACVLISECPGTAPNYLNHIKASRLRAAAKRAQPGLGKDIDRLNQIVHPVSAAIYAGFRCIDDESRAVHIQFGLRSPRVDEGREGVTVLANLAALLSEKLNELLSRPEVLSAGKPVMVRSDHAQGHA